MKFFIIGHARSGTTVLQNALNTSDDVYLLGEANLYLRGQTPHFRAQYNSQHRDSYGNQETKSTYAPRLSRYEESGTGEDYLAALESDYRIAGEKLALASPYWGNDYEKLRSWLEPSKARCLFVFRRPADVINSSAKMFAGESTAHHVLSYALTASLFLDLARVLPNVFGVIHERITEQTFLDLGNVLGADFKDSHRLYNTESARTIGTTMPEECLGFSDVIETIHHEICNLLSNGLQMNPAALQLEQKLKHRDDTNTVGRLRNLLSDLVRNSSQRIRADLAAQSNAEPAEAMAGKAIAA